MVEMKGREDYGGVVEDLVVVLVTFLLWLNTEKSLLSCVAELRLGLVRSDITVVTRDRRTVLDNILTITVRPLTGNI